MEESIEFRDHTGRSLGQTERLLYWQNIAYGGPMVTNEMIFDSIKPIMKFQVCQAFEVLMRRQKALQMRIVANSDDPVRLHFTPMETFPPVKLTFQRISDTNVLSLISEEFGKIVDVTNGPLWRATFAEITNDTGTGQDDPKKLRYAVLFTCHHSICDGISCFDLLGRQFLPLISDMVSGKDVRPHDNDIPQCSAWETTLMTSKKSVQVYEKVDVLKAEALKPGTAENVSPDMNIKLVFPNEIILADVQKPYVTSFSFDQQATLAILKKARDHGVRVHSVLLTAVSVALSQTAREAMVGLPDKLRFCWFIDLRRFLDIKSPVPLGCYTGFTQTETPDIDECSGQIFWEICKQVHSHVVKETSIEQCTAEHGIEELIQLAQSSPYGEKAMESSAIFRQPSISNLGVCEQSGNTSVLRLREYYFSEWFVNYDVVSPCFFHAITTAGGQLCWALTVNGKMIGKRFMNEHIAHIKAVLNKFCVG